MRVIAGRFRGRRLDGPDWEGLRPTSDRLRETLFNVLGERVADTRVLDGFAGAGALGIEALSRGAAHVTFVDNDPRATALISRNLAHLRCAESCVIIRADFTRAIARLSGAARDRGAAPAGDDGGRTSFDLILLDPPYDSTTNEEVVAAAAPVLSGGGLLVLEHARRTPAPAAPVGLVLTRDIRSGDSALALYARAVPDASSVG